MPERRGFEPASGLLRRRPGRTRRGAGRTRRGSTRSGSACPILPCWSRDIAEEILQAAFLKVVEKGASIRDGDRVEAWFYRILRNAVIDHYRRRDAHARHLERFTRDLDPEGPIDSGLEDAVCRCVGEIIPNLRPEYAEVLKRVDLEEGSLSEVSQGLGLTANNTTVRLHRARAALRKRLGEFCGACSEHGCLSCLCRSPREM